MGENLHPHHKKERKPYMNDSEKTQLHLAQETDKQALQEKTATLQEHLLVLEEEQLEGVTGAMDPGSPDVRNVSMHDYLKSIPYYNPLKRTAAEAGLPSNQSGPRKLLKIATRIIR
jgi:hypothetical protein